MQGACIYEKKIMYVSFYKMYWVSSIQPEDIISTS